MKQLHLFSPSSDYFLLKKGVFNGLHFRLGQTYASFPELQYAVTYANTEDDEAEFLVTLNKRENALAAQTLTCYSKSTVDCRILFSNPDAEEFLQHAHTWVESVYKNAAVLLDPPLQHFPRIHTSKKTDFGTIGPYHYVFHRHAHSEKELHPFVLICYPPQEQTPTMFLYTDENTAEPDNIHLFHRNEHILSVGKIDTHAPLQSLLTIAEERFSSSFIPSEEKFSVPILKLSLEEINAVLHAEKIYEHSILIIVLALIGNTLYTLTSIPYIGWLFLLISAFCWLSTCIHGIYAMSAIFSHLAIRIPVFTLYLLPFFFPVYGPTILLFIVLLTPIALRRSMTTKGIKVSGSNIQEDDKLLLTARKMLLTQKDSERDNA